MIKKNNDNKCIESKKKNDNDDLQKKNDCQKKEIVITQFWPICFLI